ncbi:YwmB family TATA-box binding protein [Paenibacillus nasutitermitis]|uniref:TATA-box binding n=1 Tax=Paenibacillus nasutitermitis TaxID=1652958 RepID=A0A916ZL63_9BACL|nr:YwmB family TATA-box binding protein [Paenibacillus nasutitermitis]GGE01593.1 hypothetical protein GCM10010911_70640 [Paenibacillus nasutitermitis]
MGSRSQKQQSPSPGSASRIGILAALFIVAVAAAVGFWQTRDSRSGPAADSLLHDLSAVWTWGDAEFAGGAAGAVWSFRWDGEADAASARRFGERFDTKWTLVKTPLGEAYQGEAEGGLSIWYRQHKEDSGGNPQQADGEDASVELIILLSPAKGSQLEMIKTAAAGIEEGAQAEKLSLKGSFTIRADPADRVSEKSIARLAAARQVEEYKDANTQSATYSSPALRTRIMSGNQSVNMQIAVVRSGQQEKVKLVIGIPLITGDYTAEN